MTRNERRKVRKVLLGAIAASRELMAECMAAGLGDKSGAELQKRPLPTKGDNRFLSSKSGRSARA